MNTVLRRGDVIIQEIDLETMVYDPVSAEFHLLNPLAAFVFRHADGGATLDEMVEKSRAALERETGRADVDSAVAELDRVKLLEPRDGDAAQRVTRREMVHRLAAAAVLAVPLITTLAAPAAAMAASRPHSPIGHHQPDKDKEEKDKEKEKEREREKEREEAKEKEKEAAQAKQKEKEDAEAKQQKEEEEALAKQKEKEEALAKAREQAKAQAKEKAKGK